MKNHFERTGLAPTIRDDAVAEELTLAGASDDPLLVADVEAAREVLEVPVRRTHYRRNHLHYRAMAAALDTLDAPVALDSHRWRERLVEFDPDAPS